MVIKPYPKSRAGVPTVPLPGAVVQVQTEKCEADAGRCARVRDEDGYAAPAVELPSSGVGDLAGFSDGVPVNVVQRGVLLTFSLTAKPDHDVPEETNGGDQADDQEI